MTELAAEATESTETDLHGFLKKVFSGCSVISAVSYPFISPP